MTKQQILIQAIRTAMANGFKREVGEKCIELIETGAIDFGSAEGMLIVRGLLTEHRFARALWGDNPDVCTQCESHHDHSTDCDAGGYPFSNIKQWQFRLTKLVIAKDPIRYLETTL